MKNHAEKEAGKLVPDLRLFFKKAFKEVKAKGLLYFGGPRLGHTIKIKCIQFQTVDPEICSILIFLKRIWD